MASCHVARSIRIDATADEVFAAIADFRTWHHWTPWLALDPSTKFNVSDQPASVGSTCRWSGEVLGDAEVQHAELCPPVLIKQRMRTQAPFKSIGEVIFKISNVGQMTELQLEISWGLPWYLSWITRRAEAIAGNDYDRGLQMLRDYVERGVVLSKVEDICVEPCRPLVVAGVEGQCRVPELRDQMERALCQANSALGKRQSDDRWNTISIYRSIGVPSHSVNYLMGFVVEPTADVPESLKRCDLPACQVLRVRHVGSYENLANAWSAAHQHSRCRKIRLANWPGYEIYRTPPPETPAAELVTDLYLPLR